MPVESRHAALRAMNKRYVKINDVLAGEEAIKARATTYLPPPNAIDVKAARNDARYSAYISRAVFYEATRHTLDGFSGEVFGTPPVAELAPGLEALIVDATGDGVSLDQLAKKAVRLVLSLGRAGVFVDFPDRSGIVTVEGEGSTGEPTPITRAEVDDVQPILTVYEPTKILNWRTKRFGSKTLLTLCVLEEEYIVRDDGFEQQTKKQYRVLRLSDDRRYSVQLYRDNVAGTAVFPTRGNGTEFDYIPFLFIGSETNDVTVDYPPMYALANLNLAHYRNSADYEESAFLVGQPTPVFSGLTEAWVDKYFKDGIVFGSRMAVPLPAGATADLLTASETSMIKEAMDHKERQMVALGAKLVEQKTVQRTATEAGIDSASEKSVLSTVAGNVSQAFSAALDCAADYIASTGKNRYILNQEYSINLSTPEALATAISTWQASGISFSEMRNVARKAGYATQDDKDAKKEIMEDDEAKLDQEAKRMETLSGIGSDENGKPLNVEE